MLAFQFRPFLTPAPLWDHWFWLMFPLAVAVAIVYKTAKCHSSNDLPREAGVVFLWIIGLLLGSALVLSGVVWAVSR